MADLGSTIAIKDMLLYDTCPTYKTLELVSNPYPRKTP